MEKPEGFVDIKGYEGLYAISRYGEIYKYPAIYGRCTLRFQNGCLLKPTFHSKKYLIISLKNPKEKSKGFLVHRLVAQTFIPNPKNLEQINHKDMDVTNNHVSNLEWCSHSENTCFRKKKKTSSSKYKGVIIASYRSKKTGNISIYFRSAIIKSGKLYCLGTFKTEREAALAYNEKAKELHGNFAYLNKI